MSDALPDWLVFPEAEWQTLTPAQAGFRQPDFDRTIAAHEPRPSTFWGERHAPGDFGAALTRGDGPVEVRLTEPRLCRSKRLPFGLREHEPVGQRVAHVQLPKG